MSIGCYKSGGEIIIDSFPQLILEITEVQLIVLEGNPSQLQIVAKGNVASTGWTLPRLFPFSYIAAPQIGIYEFDFKAIPPLEASATVITPIEVEYILDSLPGDLQGVRIHAEQNNVVTMLNDNSKPL